MVGCCPASNKYRNTAYLPAPPTLPLLTAGILDGLVSVLCFWAYCRSVSYTNEKEERWTASSNVLNVRP